jgi:hypothetical protein
MTIVMGATGTTGTIQLYSSNAPANAQFQFMFPSFIGTAGSGGTLEPQFTYTTPGGNSRSSSTLGLTAALTGTGLQWSAQIVTLAVGANTSLSFSVIAASGTGTPVWETEITVMRVH